MDKLVKRITTSRITMGESIMSHMSWLHAEKQLRLQYLYKELTGNIAEYEEMLTEYITILAELKNDSCLTHRVGGK